MTKLVFDEDCAVHVTSTCQVLNDVDPLVTPAAAVEGTIN